MILILALLSMFQISGVWGIMTATYQIENVATMVAVGLEVYSDVTATLKCEKIDWGVLRPGQSKTVTVYVKNTKTAPFTASFVTSNWDPQAAANFLSLQWDFGSSLLLPGRIRETHFTLTVSPSITGITSFAFLINVTATG